MRNRCNNNRDGNWDRYGARGITVCPEWNKSFEAFRDWAIANGYTSDLTIDRFPNNDGNYEPDNCRWATRKQQMNNRRVNVLVEINGRVQTVAEWADEYHMLRNTVASRLRGGWDPIRALTEPVDQSKRMTRLGKHGRNKHSALRA
jgi:hypothetical protein